MFNTIKFPLDLKIRHYEEIFHEILCISEELDKQNEKKALYDCVCILQRTRVIIDLATSQRAKFMGPTWGPPGSCRPQMGPM